MSKEKIKLPELEELLSATNHNDAQKQFIAVLEEYKKKNPKKYEIKKAEYVKKLINLA